MAKIATGYVLLRLLLALILLGASLLALWWVRRRELRRRFPLAAGKHLDRIAGCQGAQWAPGETDRALRKRLTDNLRHGRN